MSQYFADYYIAKQSIMNSHIQLVSNTTKTFFQVLNQLINPF